MPGLVKTSVVLFLAAEIVIVVAVGWDSVPLILAWALAAAGVAVVARLVTDARARVVLAAVLVAGCVLFTVELGLIFVPAAAALLAAAIVAHRRRDTRPLHGGR